MAKQCCLIQSIVGCHEQFLPVEIHQKLKNFEYPRCLDFSNESSIPTSVRLDMMVNIHRASRSLK